jgi:hypothetical protein
MFFSLFNLSRSVGNDFVEGYILYSLQHRQLGITKSLMCVPFQAILLYIIEHFVDKFNFFIVLIIISILSVI